MWPLDTADSAAGQAALTLFPDALKQVGYVERGNLVIEWRWGNGKLADLPQLAADLVRAKVELIVARTNEYTVEEVDLAIHAHPTLSEAIAEAALDSMGRVIHI